MDTLQKYAEAKRSGLNAGQTIINEIDQTQPEKTVQFPKSQYEDMHKQIELLEAEVKRLRSNSTHDGPFPWERSPWVVWGQVAGTILTLLALGYIIWLLHQPKPVDTLLQHKQEATAWLMDQMPAREVIKRVPVPYPVVKWKTAIKTVEVPKVVPISVDNIGENLELSELKEWYRLQKYIIDRFFDTPLPPGQRRKMLICGPKAGCKGFQLPVKLPPVQLQQP